jgi:hypothetical protein
MIALLLAMLAAMSQDHGRTRCGWLVNPTPGNWWLDDRAGEWMIGAQGGYQAPGMDDMPDMTTRGWIESNGHYGRGCACMSLSTERRTRRVTRIFLGATDAAARVPRRPAPAPALS